jgi:hypothetical protein
MEETKTEVEAESGFDPNRRLCPDGACVGVIGPDGRCTVCARAENAAPDVHDDVHGDFRAVEPAEGAVTTTSEGFNPTRRLCDDGTCVGVVGPDGVCGTCGRKAD